MNTSATGGFLALSPAPGRVSVEDTLHDLIAGITSLPAELVRPSWQPEPPRVPGSETTWCAFGIIARKPHNFPEIKHQGKGDGFDELISHEEIVVLSSFYGPQGEDMALLLRDGLHIAQNRALLRPAGLAFVSAQEVTFLPEVAGTGWLARADLPLTFRRQTRRTYAVLNIVQGNGRVRTENGMCLSLACSACPYALTCNFYPAPAGTNT